AAISEDEEVFSLALDAIGYWSPNYLREYYDPEKGSLLHILVRNGSSKMLKIFLDKCNSVEVKTDIKLFISFTPDKNGKTIYKLMESDSLNSDVVKLIEEYLNSSSDPKDHHFDCSSLTASSQISGETSGTGGTGDSTLIRHHSVDSDYGGGSSSGVG